jgi:hypothetical protein
MTTFYPHRLITLHTVAATIVVPTLARRLAHTR